MFNFKNYNKQGDLGVGKAITHFASKGCTISIPLTDSQEYDLVVDDGNNIQRVQVKTTKYKRNGNYVVNLKTALRGNKFKRFSNVHCDLLYILTEENDEYIIPAKDLIVTTSLSLGKQYEKYKLER